MLGLVLGLALHLCEDLILGNIKASDEIMKMMDEYYLYVCLLPVWHMVGELLFSVIWNAGDDLYCVISMVAKLFVNIVASIVLKDEDGDRWR